MGLVYVALTLVCMAVYAGIIESSTTNDLYWASYNRSGCAAFLMDIVNAKLQAVGLFGPAQPTHVDLLGASDDTSPRQYAIAGIQTIHEASYGRVFVYSALQPLARALGSLRTTSSSYIPHIYAQYCWVDLDRRWELAHSSARATRCLERYTDNAANYVETMLRNTDRSNFIEWHDDAWEITIASALRTSADGVQWLADRPRHALSLSIDDEVRYLEHRNVTRFEMQYQNDFFMAITETIEVVNALAQRHTMPLKGVPFESGPWTTLLMYWNFRNDLMIFASWNKSIVRGDARHFEQTGRTLSSMYGVSDDNDKYFDQFGIFHDQIGPFGSVDVLYVPLPISLQAMYTAIRALVDPSVVTMSPAVPELGGSSTLMLVPAPPNFHLHDGMTYRGGNLLCFNNPPTAFPQSQFAMGDPCTSVKPFSIAASRRAIVFGLLATRQSHVPSICAVQHNADMTTCIRTLTQFASRIDEALGAATNASIATVRHLTTKAAAALTTVQFFQYAQPANSTEWALLQQPLLVDDDPNWSFYGWLAFFDWIEGKREVVRLEGDVAAVTMMSEQNPPVLGASIAQHDDQAQSGPRMLLYLIYYTTGVAVALGVVVGLYAARNGLDVDGRKLVAFHRVASIVWIGRPLLFLRGLTAILALSTTTSTIVRSEVDVAMLAASPRRWWEVFVLAGESTCVCGVVCDLVLITATASAHLFAPLACLVSWGATVVLEVVDPISVELTLDRHCTIINTQSGVTCTAGLLSVGSFDRMVVLLAIQCASVVVCLCGVVLVKRGQRTGAPPRPSLLLYGAAVAHFSNQHLLDAWHLDDVACVLTGLVPFTFRGIKYAFDVKLWVLLETESARSAGALKNPDTSSPSLELVPATSRAAFYRRATVLAGFGYLILSAIGSVSYISVSTVNFANDFYWATFNMTGHHVAIADWIHLNLPNRDFLASVRLDETRWTIQATNYSNLKLRIHSYSLMGPILQLKHTTQLDVAIAGLRRSDPCEIPWISTQYCWVDFGRKWPMANSAARQRRCQSDATNGAVYMEAVLRNVEWSAWSACWGAGFDAAIANELKLTVEGQAWLATTRAAFATDIASEIDVWRQAGIEEYVVQWQNYKSLGLINTYVIENALGVQYPMTLRRSNGSYYFPVQTSFKMYWGLGSDLWAVASNATAISGKSLISTSANYAFANQSMVDVLLENHTIVAPLYQAFQVVQREVGPFGSIDMRIVPCPSSVQAAVATAIDVIQRTVATHPSIASHGIFNLRNEMVYPVPGVFKRLAAASSSSVGGSVLCPETSESDIEVGLFRLTRRGYVCGGSYVSDLPTVSYGLLFAAMAAQLHQANQSHVDGVCWHIADSERCLSTFLDPTVSFIGEFIHADDFTVLDQLVSPAAASVQQLQVSLVQFIRSPLGDVQLGRAALLDPDDATYAFWSWMYVYSWATGSREVVTFQGDEGAVTLITDVADNESHTIHVEDMPTTFAAYAQRGVQYITGVLLAVAGCAGLCILSSRGRVEGLNMFELNRVAGIVWVGRPLLLLRGVTALCLLSTSTLKLVRVGRFFAAFQVSRLPWYTAVLGAGEVTWVAYVLNDVLMVWTTDLTQVYAACSSIFIWITCAVLTVVSPVGHHATIEPACQIDQMDFQLVCQSGVVAIGDSTRLVWLVAIVVLWNAVCFAGPWLVYRSRLPSESAPASLLLSTGAKFLFDRTHWMYDGVYYMDTASALLNGVVAIHWGRTVYVVDVKLWRSFVLSIDKDVPERLVRAVPLPR